MVTCGVDSRQVSSLRNLFHDSFKQTLFSMLNLVFTYMQFCLLFCMGVKLGRLH